MENIKQGLALLEMLNNYKGSLETLFTIGFALMSVLMTILKSGHIWQNFGMEKDLFSMIPKIYRRYVPLLLGAFLGLVNSYIAPVAGMGHDIIMGAIVLGGGNQVAYHQLKGLSLGKLIEFLLKTEIKK